MTKKYGCDRYQKPVTPKEFCNFLGSYYQDGSDLRLGQALCNEFLVNACPELFYEKSERLVLERFVALYVKDAA